MDRVKILEKKIHQVVERLGDSKQEQKKLSAEVKFLEEENKKIKNFMHENAKWKENKKALINRIEKLIKRIDSIEQA
ncbi:MAG: cell division protein ZapB [Endomicrobiales bacterium]|nr:cell division protein ZapB [Endomicrobiales bacterium]